MAEDNPFADASISGASASEPAPPAPEAEPSWLSSEPATTEAETTSESASPGWLGLGGAGAETKAEPEKSAAPPPDPGPPMETGCFKLPRPIQAMRAANVLSAFLLALIACLKLGSSAAHISTCVIAVYLFAFSLLITVFETHCSWTAKIIANNLGFMYTATGRTCFLLLVAMLCFSGYAILGALTGVILILTALFNGFILFKYPNYERSIRIVDLGE